MKFYGCRPLARPMLDNKIEPSVFHKYLMSVPDTSAAWHRLERTNWMYMQTTYLHVNLMYFVCSSLSMQLTCTNASLLVRTTDKGSSVIYTLHSQFTNLQFPIFQGYRTLQTDTEPHTSYGTTNKDYEQQTTLWNRTLN